MATTRTKPVSDSMLSVLQRMSLRDMLIVGETTDRVMADMTRFAQVDAVSEGAGLEVASRESLAMAYGYDDEDDGTRKPFVFQDGIAVIPVHGTLINRFNSSWGFVTGYNYVRRMLNLALDDDDVEFIVFDIDSPGGEAAGCFELAREIMASRRVKPSLAMVDSLAASGGIALMAVATTAYAIPSARIGSIGVYRMHISYEGALKQSGIKVTFAKAGEHKVDGNPYQDLPQSVLDEWTESAGKTWDDFIALVAEARDMSDADVRATQARVYRSDEALALGLIDAVKTTTEAVDAWMAELADDDPSNDEEDENMSEQKKGAGSEVTSGLTAEAVAAMIGTAISSALKPLVAQTRATAITTCAEAKGKPKLAATLAANEAISLEDAKTILVAAAPEGKVSATKGKQKVADVKDEDDSDEDDSDDTDEADDDTDEDDDDSNDEEAAEAARRARLGKGKSKAKGKSPRDNVNHLDQAMGSGNRSRSPGAGNDDDDDGGDSDEAATARILGDHNRVAGSGWSNLKPAKKTKAA